MKTFYCDTFVLPLPEGHRFPMEKLGRLAAGGGYAADVRDTVAIHAATVTATADRWEAERPWVAPQVRRAS